MYTLINGSPKVSNSNSEYFLNIISKELNNYNYFEIKNNNYKDIINSIEVSDTIILSFPLYVDSPTSIMLNFLDYIIDNKISIKNKLIYVIINCGFKEGEQNITALNIIKRWCNKVNTKYNGSILIGAGEVVGKKKYKYISKKTLKELKYFSYKVRDKKYVDDIITTMDILNNKMYTFIANINWTKSCKKNNLSKKDIRLK